MNALPYSARVPTSRPKKSVFDFLLGVFQNHRKSPRHTRLENFFFNLVPNCVLANCIQEIVPRPSHTHYSGTVWNATTVFQNFCINQPRLFCQGNLISHIRIIVNVKEMRC